MVKRRTVAICLGVTGAVVSIGLLYLAIHGEFGRLDAASGQQQDRSNKGGSLAKLILITAADGRPPAAAAGQIKRSYDGFLASKSDAELAFASGWNETLHKLDGILNLTFSDQDVLSNNHELLSPQGMYDELFAWLSSEGTELDSESDTHVKQLCLMCVERAWISQLMERLKLGDKAVDLFAIEARVATENVEILTIEAQKNDLAHLRSFASLNILRHGVCPASTPTDSKCKMGEE